MTLIAVTQRVTVVPEYGERRDAADQAWTRFLDLCGLTPLFVPNVPAVAERLVAELPVRGLLLTGGNDLSEYGGDAPERDETERALVDLALRRRLPVVGVCRGMQVLQARWGVPLTRVEGHVTAGHEIIVDGAGPDQVNSYHRWGSNQAGDELMVWARAADGIVEGIRHKSAPVIGLMWHPERCQQPRPSDVTLFRHAFREVS